MSDVESVLDLPEERQREIAQEMGIAHSEWVRLMKDSLNRTAKDSDELSKKDSKSIFRKMQI